MAELMSNRNLRPPTATLIGAVLVLAGFLLTAVDWRFLTLSALGTFGPGILREWGWVKDKDEFQLLAARRAGYHAYLAGGLTAFIAVGLIRAAGDGLARAGELVTLVLAVLWLTWLLSSLLAYWGPRKTVSRILVIFGSVWLLFNILANTGAEYQGPATIVLQSLLAVPFFLLAWVAGRWPWLAGIALVLLACFFVYFFGLYKVFGSDPMANGRLMVAVLFVGPLLASGVILLGKPEASSA